jgi:hypothetical protein
LWSNFSAPGIVSFLLWLPLVTKIVFEKYFSPFSFSTSKIFLSSIFSEPIIIEDIDWLSFITKSSEAYDFK